MGKFDKAKQDILNCAAWLCEQGYFGCLRGSGGNISVKIKDQNMIAITPSRRPYQKMSADDICVLDYDLKPLEGRRTPSVETAMHIRVYERRPDVGAIIHTHSVFACVLSILNQPIPALFDEITFEIGACVEIIPYALSGSADLAQQVVSQLDNNCFCYLLQNHGALSLGQDIDQAWKNAELLEKVAQVYYYASATGSPITTLPKDAIDQINKMRQSKF